LVLSALVSAALLTGSQQETRAQDSVPGSPSDNPVYDPLDPFDLQGSDELTPSTDDKDKSATELVAEAVGLMRGERLLDARTKLLKALQKDPNDYSPYYYLAYYYMVHVGHYRLALKYIRRAEELFEKQNGPPPYSTFERQSTHAGILYYLSQIRLNLDNYQGSLEDLDRFTALGYYADWYPGSRAWVLMKLGRIKEAIQVARMGLLANAEPGRTLNMLGILLSMNDQPSEALEVFRQAIATEMSLGTAGQPATPLNNAGEVYRELFDDDKAESTFLRATSLPDGCEHVLPSLNLTLLYIDELKFESAAAIMDNFQRCVAQYPLRNGEEHVALVALARGRIDLHTGHVDRAIQRFESALEGTQWFGKIGTNQNDLEVAATISLAQALDRMNNILKFRRPLTWGEWLDIRSEAASNRVRQWWLMRRARQILVDELNDIEDLTIRNTDSLIEYPTFGEVLNGFSRSSIVRRLEKQRQSDKRGPAQLFYDAYLADSSLGWWNRSEGNKLLDGIIERARPKTDELLRTHAMLQRMSSLNTSTPRYRELAYRVFNESPAELRSYGFRLPIAIDGGSAAYSLRTSIVSGPFMETGSRDGVCILAATSTGQEHELRFSCPGNSSKTRVVRESDPNKAVNKLADSLFTEEISNGGNS
jgi:Tfp pilus assembly protein PilF